MFVFLFSVLLITNSTAAFSNSNSEMHCDPAHWAAPAESNHGIFRGDLLMDCWITKLNVKADLAPLRSGIIEKLRAESIIHEGPIFSKLGSLPALKWDVSHMIQEDGNTLTIREEAVLATDRSNQLFYSTHSKEVSATGMAGYLRSVNFSMNVKKRDHSIHVELRNEVQVDRPWYALDLIFAPIARNVCFKKMDEVKAKILPWVFTLL
jgi:hypothetical protein